MRALWGVIITCCLGIAAFAQEAKPSAPPNDAGQGSPASAPQTATGADEKKSKEEPPPKDEPQAAPQSKTKSEAQSTAGTAASAVQTNEPKTEPNAEPRTVEPKAERATTSSPSEPKTEAQTKSESDAAAPNGKRGTGKRTSAGTGEEPAGAAAGGGRKIVREGGADEPKAQIVTGMTAEEASRERQRAEQLLKSAVETLEGLDERAFNPQQQETVSQIHNYMDGARSALKEGDIVRAHTLAVKANLLAEDLARR